MALFKFRINGHFEFQEVDLYYFEGEENAITIEVTVDHTEFNGADGSREYFRSFKEIWKRKIVRRCEHDICISVKNISYVNQNSEYQQLCKSRLLYPYNLSIDVLEIVSLVKINQQRKEVIIVIENLLSKDRNDQFWMERAREINGSHEDYK